MDSKELEGKKVAELKEMAKELGIKGISSMKKADLVAAISSAAEAPPEPCLARTRSGNGTRAGARG